MERTRILVDQVRASAKNTTTNPAVPISSQDRTGALPKLGDETDFTNEAGEPDFRYGLTKLARKIPEHLGMGYYTSFRQASDGRVLESQVILCNDAAYITEIMETEVQHYLWGGVRPASEAFFGARVLFVLEGKEWQDIRQTMRPILTPNNLAEVTGDLVIVANEFTDKLSAYEGQRVDLSLAIRCFHISAVTRTLYTTEIPALRNFPERHPVHIAFDYLLDELARRAFHKDLDVQMNYTSDTADNKAWRDAKDLVHNTVYEELRERLERGTLARGKKDKAPSCPAQRDTATDGNEGKTSQCPMKRNPDMLSQLLQEYEKSYPSADAKKKMEDLGANLVELIFAGYNTVVNTMCIALLHLVQRPELLKRARAEVDTHIPEEISFDALEKLEFLQKVFLETLRLDPPAPGIARKTERDHTLGSVIVPKGSEIMFPMCAVHRDPKYWGNNADEFEPDRWSQEYPPNCFMPFSAGPRRCLGQHYARLFFKICLATLLKNFEFEVSKDFKFRTFFNGFGTMVWDDTTNSNTMPMILRKRKGT